MKLTRNVVVALILILASCGQTIPPATTSRLATTATSASVQAVLSRAGSARLHRLGGGCEPDTQQTDLLLIQRGFRSGDPDDRHSAYLAIEKLGYCYAELLDRTYIASIFPQLLDEITSADEKASEFASRAIGALAGYTDLLTPDQIDQAYQKAMRNLQSKNYEYSRRGVNLLGDLIPKLERSSQENAFARLLSLFEERQQTNELEWWEYENELAARGSAQQRFQLSAIQAFLGNCGYIQSEAQALAAYEMLVMAFEQHELDSQVLPSIASLVRILPPLQRQAAIDLIIASIADRRSWYYVGSGVIHLANYANSALLILAPILDKDDLQRALDTIEAQEWQQEEQQVFEETYQAVRQYIERKDP